jgi:hypothetical protein
MSQKLAPRAITIYSHRAVSLQSAQAMLNRAWSSQQVSGGD